jgi:2',3'-cyclic-nucleotide 2'-phosphodiesterase (5'-nucleotidase family)
MFPEQNKPKKYLNKIARIIVILSLTVVSVIPAYAQSGSAGTEKTLLILHTNDMHDHVRPDYDGIGGIPFISGFVSEVRSQRNDVIVLDAGDVAEKGDLVARKTGSELTFEALSRIGYHAWTPGNHDHDFGIAALRRFTELAGMDILCINLLKEDGSTEFDPSGIYNIDGLRVGVIGAIVPRKDLSLNLEETARAMARESQRLKPETDIVLALVHMSVRDAVYISNIAADIDVFITGHSHQRLHEAVSVPQTGALVVQAGSDANYVGWLELTIDTRVGKILSYDSKLVEMNHLVVSPDLELLEWVRRKEVEISPEAQKIVGWAPREINYAEVGYLAAEALRKATEADIAFNHSEQIIRSTLPAGILDVNAIYRTGGERGHRLIEIELSGSEIHNYLQGLQVSRWIQTQWSGFHGVVEDGIFKSNLEMERLYRVVMPEMEWETRFQNLFRRVTERPNEYPGISPPDRALVPKVLDISWTDAMISLLNEWKRTGIGLVEGLQKIVHETGQTIHILLMEYQG